MRFLNGLFLSVFIVGVFFCGFNSVSAKNPGAEDVSFQSADGVKQAATAYQVPDSKGTVLLLHMLGRSKNDYGSMIQPLLRKGFSVLSVDFRGHGASTVGASGARLDYRNFKDADWQKLPGDVAGILKQLPANVWAPSRAIFVVGASIGANAAVMASANVPGVKALVLLSPGLDYHGLKPEDAVAKFPGPILIVASTEDEYAYSSSRQLRAIDPRRIAMTSLDKAGHGTQMFSSQPRLTEDIAVWLSKQLVKK